MRHLLLKAEAGGSGLLQVARETGEAFGFNWQLFLSQIVSFCLVAFLLHRFAYKPILTVLEERRQRIADGLKNAEKIREQLADAEAKHAEILQRANGEAQKLIDEARTSSAAIAERRQQEAIAQAESIISKAREATTIEREKILSQLRGEVGRLVVETTAKVTGKVLTLEDQKRLMAEASREVAA